MMEYCSALKSRRILGELPVSHSNSRWLSVLHMEACVPPCCSLRARRPLLLTLCAQVCSLRGRRCEYVRLIDANVWQKPAQYYKAIILQ